ncbi:MAG TPA: TrmH family RNA methyltransferase [Marinagarivorans sp.]
MKSVVILQNIEKNTNLGQLIRTCNALGVAEVCVLGRKKYASFGNQRTHSSTAIRHFFDYPSAYAFYKKQGYRLVAVEISPRSESVNRVQFGDDTAFVMGNEGQGVPQAALALCDAHVHIPQYGAGASLNVNVACGIVLNAFMASAPRTPNPIVQHKFIAASGEAE